MSVHEDLTPASDEDMQVVEEARAVREMLAVLRLVKRRQAGGGDVEVDVDRAIARWGHLSPAE